MPGPGEKACTTAIGLKAEMADADETVWQHVQEETLDEVLCIEGEELLLVASAPVAIAEGHATVLKGHQPFVADGDAVSVATEVTEHLGWAGHGSFAVNDPILGSSLL